MQRVLRVFDPALCCATGVCGPDAPDELVRFAADLEWLRAQGVPVERYNLAQQPAAFEATPAVRAALAQGTATLPLVLVGDRIAADGAYPSRATLAAITGVPLRRVSLAQAPAASCCAPGASEADAAGKPGCC